MIEETGDPAKTVGGKLEIAWDKRSTPQSFGECAADSVDASSADLLNPDGTFAFDGLPTGHFVLTVSGREIAETRIPIEINESLHTDLGDVILPKGRVIRGRLIEAGEQQPLDNLKHSLRITGRVSSDGWLRGEKTELDHEGRFRISQLPADTTQITLLVSRMDESGQPKGFGPKTIQLVTYLKPLDLTEITLLEVGDIVAQAERFEGRIIDGETNEPLGPDAFKRFSITAAATSSFEAHYDGDNESIDPEGRFSIKRARSDFDTLTIKIPGYLPYVLAGPKAADSNGVISLGEIPLDRGCTLSGVVRGPNGEVVSKCSVQASGSGVFQSAGTDDQGRFVVRGLRPGTAIVHATAYRADGKNLWVPKAQRRSRNSVSVSSVSVSEDDVDIRDDIENRIELQFQPPYRE